MINSKLIKNARLKRGISLVKACKIISETQGVKVAPTSLSKYENGDGEPLYRAGVAIAEAFGIEHKKLIMKEVLPGK